MEKLYNLAPLEKVTGGDPAFMNKMIQLFITTIPDSIEVMSIALDQEDYRTLSASAHKIKPSISYMCIGRLHDQVREIEAMESTNDIKSITNQFIVDLKLVLEQLKQLK